MNLSPEARYVLVVVELLALFFDLLLELRNLFQRSGT